MLKPSSLSLIVLPGLLMYVEPHLLSRVPRRDQSQDPTAPDASLSLSSTPSPGRQFWEREIKTAPTCALPGLTGSKGRAPLPCQPRT